MRTIFSCVLLLGLLCVGAVAAVAGPLPAGAVEHKDASGFLVHKSVSEIAVAPDAETTINVLLRFIAPRKTTEKPRQPLNISLVVDRSGSMNDAKKMDYALSAAKLLVRSLEKDDQFSLVIYDDVVEVLAPLGPVKDKDALLKAIDGVFPRGYTFLSGGLEAGIGQFKGKEMAGNRRVLLLSDGLANRGVIDRAKVAEISAAARKKGIAVSAMGLGLEYDESMMELLAQRGGGAYYYVAEAEDLGGFFRQELALANNAFSRNMQVRFVPDEAVTGWKVFGYSVVKGDKGKGIVIETGDIYEGEERQILLQLTTRAKKVDVEQLLGNVVVEFQEAEQGDKGPRRTVTTPLTVRVLADAGARAKANEAAAPAVKVVQEEVALMEAEEAHVAALEELNKGNVAEAKSMMSAKAASLQGMAAASPAIANKLEVMQKDVAQADQAAADSSLRQQMTKKGKESKYLAAQGKKSGLFLQRGDSGARVERLQRLLAEKGMYKGAVDGVYSEEVAKAVSAFQKEKSLAVDGVAGQLTLDALNF